MVVRRSAKAGAGVAGESYSQPAAFPAVPSPSGRGQGDGGRPAFVQVSFPSEVSGYPQ